MNKKLYAAMLLVSILLAFTSCDDSLKTATFHVQNYSSFDVTDIWVPGRSSENNCKNLLQAGQTCTLISTWVENTYIFTRIYFIKDGEEYGCREKEEAEADPTGRFKTYKRIKDGDTVIVKIYDNHWEW